MSRVFLWFFCLALSLSAHLPSTVADGDTEQIIRTAGMSTTRKLGKHGLSKIAMDQSSPGAAEAPAYLAGGPSGAEDHHGYHHRSVDKSVAGGGVILGGLATVFLVAVFCYIRATGRKAASEPASPTNSNSSIGKTKNGQII